MQRIVDPAPRVIMSPEVHAPPQHPALEAIYAFARRQGWRLGDELGYGAEAVVFEISSRGSPGLSRVIDTLDAGADDRSDRYFARRQLSSAL